MQRNIRLVTLFSLVLWFGRAAGADWSFTSIDYPGAVATVPQGISPGGDIVGFYTDAQGAQHGFVLRHGAFRSIEYPGAAYTDARSSNPSGDIVGNYRMAGEDPMLGSHGFVLKVDGTFVPIPNFPGHINMITQRILPNGSVLGCYHDYDFMASMHGFVRGRGQFSDLSVEASMNNGATPDLSQITGLFFDMTAQRWRAYVVQNGNFTPFDFPGSIFTQAWDMNPSGAIVGEYIDSSGTHHGFLLEEEQMTSVDFPGAAFTNARGINPGGDIVGKYVDSGGTSHGFLGSRR